MTNATLEAVPGVAECEAEAIRTPGRLQSYGCLLAFSQTGALVAASDNATQMLDRPAIAIGQSAAEVIGNGIWQTAKTQVCASETQRPVQIDVSNEQWPLATRFEILAHHADNLIILEFLPRVEIDAACTAADLHSGIHNIFRQALVTAERIKAITGYDRVMIYRFHPDWSGEVIAEVRAPEMTPYLGLRYPATDIPSQARELYLQNAVRMIPDVRASTVALRGSRDLDLGFASLRAVSPYHLEYLRNMGVSATLTLSIIVEGKLWGMVACHHRAERQISHNRQGLALEVVRKFESDLGADLERQAAAAQTAVNAALARWTAALQGSAIFPALLSGSSSILAHTNADGAAFIFAGECLGVGATPEIDWLMRAAQGLRARGTENVVVSDCLQALSDAPDDLATAGAMMIDLGGQELAALFVFRCAQAQEVHWGGDPSLAVQISPRDGKPSPRSSFALWKETVVDRCVPWSPTELEVFKACGQALGRRVGKSDARQQLRADLEAAGKQLLYLSEAQELLVDALPCGAAVLLSTIDCRGPRLLYANRRFTELLGLELHELVDQSPDYILSRTQLDPSLLSVPTGEDTEVEVWSPGQGLRHMRARRETVMRQRRANSSELNIEALLLTDATNDRRTLDALTSAVRHAEQARHATSALMRNVSHELRTPLNAILGYSDLMALELCGPLGQEAYRDAAAEIASSARHLLNLINDALDMAQLESGKLRLSEAICDLSSIVDQALNFLQILASDRQIEIRRIGLAGPLFARVDETAMRQIITNLISNALKFTEAGGAVEVYLSRDESGAGVISVRDTGIGIAESDLPKLFKPFSQIDNQMDRERGGNGLGLAIVKSLVQLHGATIDVQSQKGCGSDFTIRLPTWRMEYTQ